MTTYFIVYLAIITCGFLVGISFFKKDSNKIWPITIYLGLVILLEVSNHHMAVIYQNNMPGFHVSFSVYFSIIGIFFYYTILDEKIKRSIPWTIGLLIVFAIVNAIFFQPLNTFPDNVSKVTSFFCIVWAAVLFVQHLDLSSEENIFKNPVFITAIAILWFNIISLSFFLLYPFMTKHNLPSKSVFMIHYFSNYVYYLLLLLSIVLAKIQVNNDKRILR